MECFSNAKYMCTDLTLGGRSDGEGKDNIGFTDCYSSSSYFSSFSSSSSFSAFLNIGVQMEGGDKGGKCPLGLGNILLTGNVLILVFNNKWL